MRSPRLLGAAAVVAVASLGLPWTSFFTRGIDGEPRAVVPLLALGLGIAAWTRSRTLALGMVAAMAVVLLYYLFPDALTIGKTLFAGAGALAWWAATPAAAGVRSPEPASSPGP